MESNFIRKIAFIFLIVLSFFILFHAAFAGPEDVSLIPLSRWDYINVDGYGFYDKCGDTSWFAVVLHNGTDHSYTVSIPAEARVTGWNGTVHPLKNTRYKVMDFGNNNFLREDRPEIAFTGDLLLPAQSTYAILMDVTQISAYNLYWDTNVFFTITLKSDNKTSTINISGILAQRGNACPADQVCSARVLSGSYASNGSGEVVVRIDNNMPDSAGVSALSRVDITWTDASGKKQSQTIDQGVEWNAQPGWMGSGTQKTISGLLSLPVDITAVNHDLTLKFHFHHPSSLWFGDFEAEKKLTMTDGLQGAMTGSFEADGSGGVFNVILNNHQNKEVKATLPQQGSLQSTDGSLTDITLRWEKTGPVDIPAQGTAELRGSFVFSDIRQIHNNDSLIISAEFTASGQKGTAAGTILRNPDPNPKLTSISFCRDYIPGSKQLTFVYTLRNESHIDIPVQLAGTLAVDEQPRNLTIQYTDCRSGGRSCKSRLNSANFTIEAGETASFYGKVTLETIPQHTDISVYTSLLYVPDGVTKALYVGKTDSACTGASDVPVPTATVVPYLDPGEPVLEASFTSGSYARCGSDPSLHFTLNIHNSGTAAGVLNTNKLHFNLDGSDIPVTIASCAEMSAIGTDTESCKAGLASGSLTVNPEVSVRLEALYAPEQTIEADHVRITAVSEELADKEFGFDIISVSASCKPIVETVPGTNGRDVLADFSEAGNQVTLSVRLVNSGTKEAYITPGTIYLHNSALDSYQGTADIDLVSPDSPVGKTAAVFAKDETIILPARSASDFSVTLNFDPGSVKVENADVSWHFGIDNESRNYTGSIIFPQKQTPEPIEESEESDGNDAVSFFSVSEPTLPAKLPATGFNKNSGHSQASVQQKYPAYQSVNGLHIEIPVIYASMDVVSVPLDGNGEWDVEWLTDQAGILDSSPLPGEGTTVVAAHNHLDEGNYGPFVSIFMLDTNDRIIITDKDGNLLIYKVYANELVTPDDSASVYRTAIPGSMVLMTCEIEKPEGGYAYRRLIYAEPLQ